MNYDFCCLQDLASAQQRLRELEASGFVLPRHELILAIPILADLGDAEMAAFYMNNL